MTPIAGGIDLRLLTGRPADTTPDTACIEIAQPYATTVTLEQPLISQSME